MQYKGAGAASDSYTGSQGLNTEDSNMGNAIRLRESFKQKVNNADFKISDVMHVTRLCYVFLLAYSMFCNFRLGWSLSAIGWMALVQASAYMMLDVAGVAYMKLAKDGQPQAWVGFFACLLASFIAGWSFQVSNDAMARSGLTGPAVEALQNMATYADKKSGNVPEGNPINQLLSDRKAMQHMESYTAAVLVASEKLGYPAAHALFHESELFRDDPEGWMAIVRGYFMALLLISSVWIPSMSWNAERNARNKPDPEPMSEQPGPDYQENRLEEGARLALVS